MKEWEDIVKEADEKKGRGESTGSPPPSTIFAKRMTNTFNKSSSGSSQTVAPSVLKSSQANTRMEAEAAHASSGLSATKYRCLVTGCKSKDKSWQRLDNFRSHLAIVHGSFLSSDEDELSDLIRR
jgi:hypothetical protein